MSKTYDQIVGANIASLRKGADMKQETLGRQVEVYLGKRWSKQTVSLIERGLQPLTVTQLIAVAIVLNATTTALLAPKQGRTFMEPTERIELKDWSVPVVQLWQVLAPKSYDMAFAPFDTPDDFVLQQKQSLTATPTFPSAAVKEDDDA